MLLRFDGGKGMEVENISGRRNNYEQWQGGTRVFEASSIIVVEDP